MSINQSLTASSWLFGHAPGHSGFDRIVIAALIAALNLTGCGSKSGLPMSTHDPHSTTSLGAHSLVFQRMGGGRESIATPSLRTRPAGTVVIIGVGRGDAGSFSLPRTDAPNPSIVQLGESHAYTKYPQSGTALYWLKQPSSAAGVSVTTTTSTSDEVTLAAVEVAGTKIQAVAWNEARPGKLIGRLTVRSNSVTTTGPATLVAFWWGDAGIKDVKTAEPGDGFQLIDAVLEEGALVQCAVAIKQVAEAGTYDIRWTTTPRQSAQLWLVAVE